MGHANIYIRKENEDRWDSLEDKSAWVNVKLASDVAVLPLKPMTGVIKAIPTGETVHDLSTLQDRPILKPARAAVKPVKRLSPVERVKEMAEIFDVKLCKHGASPEFCKFAKVVNGKKVCK